MCLYVNWKNITGTDDTVDLHKELRSWKKSMNSKKCIYYTGDTPLSKWESMVSHTENN